MSTDDVLYPLHRFLMPNDAKNCRLSKTIVDKLLLHFSFPLFSFEQAENQSDN